MSRMSDVAAPLKINNPSVIRLPELTKLFGEPVHGFRTKFLGCRPYQYAPRVALTIGVYTEDSSPPLRDGALRRQH